ETGRSMGLDNHGRHTRGAGDTAKTKRCPPPRYADQVESHGRIPVLQGAGGSQWLPVYPAWCAVATEKSCAGRLTVSPIWLPCPYVSCMCDVNRASAAACAAATVAATSSVPAGSWSPPA